MSVVRAGACSRKQRQSKEPSAAQQARLRAKRRRVRQGAGASARQEEVRQLMRGGSPPARYAARILLA